MNFSIFREHILNQNFDKEKEDRLVKEFRDLWRSSKSYVKTEELRSLFVRLNYYLRTSQLDYMTDKVDVYRNGTIYFPGLLENFKKFTEDYEEAEELH